MPVQGEEQLLSHSLLVKLLQCMSIRSRQDASGTLCSVCVVCFDCVLQSPVWLLSSTHLYLVLIPYDLHYTCAAGHELFM